MQAGIVEQAQKSGLALARLLKPGCLQSQRYAVRVQLQHLRVTPGWGPMFISKGYHQHAYHWCGSIGGQRQQRLWDANGRANIPGHPQIGGGRRITRERAALFIREDQRLIFLPDIAGQSLPTGISSRWSDRQFRHRMTSRFGFVWSGISGYTGWLARLQRRVSM